MGRSTVSWFRGMTLLAALLLHAACANPSAGPAPELRKVGSLEALPGLADRMDRQFGTDFVLHYLPREAVTVETAFAHLVGENSSRLVRKELTRPKTVYGGELTVRRRDETLVFFVYAADDRFSEVIAYSVTDSNGHPWGVYLCHR